MYYMHFYLETVIWVLNAIFRNFSFSVSDWKYEVKLAVQFGRSYIIISYSISIGEMCNILEYNVAKNYVETFFPGHFTAIIHFGLIKLILCQYFLFLSVDTLQSRWQVPACIQNESRNCYLQPVGVYDKENSVPPRWYQCLSSVPPSPSPWSPASCSPGTAS